MGYISNEEEYIAPGLRIPVEPVILPCQKCQSEDYPNYRNDLIEIDGVLCFRHLEQEAARHCN